MRITGIDHVVLYVADVPAAAEFYGRVLDGDVREYGDDWRTVQLGDSRINFRPAAEDGGLVAEEPTSGAGDLCLVTEAAIETVVDRLGEEDVEVIEGPIGRNGALGSMTSVYFRDPDGNLVEVAEYD